MLRWSQALRCAMLLFKVYGVQWKEIIFGIPVSIIFGQVSSRKRSWTGEAAVTFRRNFAVIFIDLPVSKLKRKRFKGIRRVTTVLALCCVYFGDFLEVKTCNLKNYLFITCGRGSLYHQTKTIYCGDGVQHRLFLRRCVVRRYFFRGVAVFTALQCPPPRQISMIEK